MPLILSSRKIRLTPEATVYLAMTMALVAGGCARIAGNYPPSGPSTTRVTARFHGEGFQLLAGSCLRVDRVEAELRQLRSQGFSRWDPQIIKSVAKRRNVPPALLTDRSGCAYYRVTARLDAGTNLTLAPGALEVTLKTDAGTIVVRDMGFLVEDRNHSGGCRPSSGSTLAFGDTLNTRPVVQGFLVRLPVRGEIVGLGLAPRRGEVVRGRPTPDRGELFH